jgi:catechol 2,3-dioxygenase-like lactoylglutathione lyase family enzyme
MIGALNHVTFSVRDLERAFTFYQQVLGLRALARWDRGAYLPRRGNYLGHPELRSCDCVGAIARIYARRILRHARIFRGVPPAHPSERRA